MKGRLFVLLDESSNRIELSPYTGIDEYLVTIYVKDMTSYKDIVNNDELFYAMLWEYKTTYSSDVDNENLNKFVKSNSDKIREFYQTSDEISFVGDPERVKEYIEENELTNKKIVYNRVLPLKRETLKRVKEIFNGISHVEFIVEGNGASISLESYEDTLDKIEEIASNVRKLGLSPMEEMMYVYDLVRNREYVGEDDNEEYTASRDLTSVLFGDKIVCVGFAVLFNSILNCLGYNTINFVLRPLDKQDGHMRSLVYVKDDKYEIDGLYFFDPTYDCKQEDNSFLERYLFFAKSYKQITKLDCGCYQSDYYRFMDDECIDEIEEIFPGEEIHFSELLMQVRVSALNKLLRITGQEELTLMSINISKEDLIEKMCDVSLLANKNITYDKFLEILYNVRRQQYYINPGKYAFDMNSITNILIKSKVASKATCDKERLLMAILGVDPVVSTRDAQAKVKEYFERKDLERDMARVKFARLLKVLLDKKENEEQKKLKK